MVQIQRIIVVYGAPEQRALIADGRVGIVCCTPHRRYLLHHLGRKLRQQLALVHGVVGDAHQVGFVVRIFGCGVEFQELFSV